MDKYLSDNELNDAAEKLGLLRKSLEQVLFGQEELIEMLLVALFAGGHVLLEGLPGLGKTALVKGLGQAIELAVKRVQFTPDLLPGDITGNPILQENAAGKQFVFQAGPIFTNLLLADEINRASPKTQSALLEAMAERRVTVMGETHPLPLPFFVLATQNPIELEGTYPLPEAQLDRFLFKINVSGVGPDVLEQIITRREIGVDAQIPAVCNKNELTSLMGYTRRIYLPEVVVNYIARIVHATQPKASRTAAKIKFGASPRAALSFAAAARSRALLSGRINASFEDVEACAFAVLQHRLILDYSAKVEGATPLSLIKELLQEVPRERHKTALTLKAQAGE